MGSCGLCLWITEFSAILCLPWIFITTITLTRERVGLSCPPCSEAPTHLPHQSSTPSPHLLVIHYSIFLNPSQSSHLVSLWSFIFIYQKEKKIKLWVVPPNHPILTVADHIDRWLIWEMICGLYLKWAEDQIVCSHGHSSSQLAKLSPAFELILNLSWQQQSLHWCWTSH